MSERLLLVTGAAGKVGQAFLRGFLADQRFADWRLRVLLHRRPLPADPRIEQLHGSIADRAVARAAMAGAQRVLHLATCKENADDAMDVAVKGLFWLLEEARGNAAFEQFVLLSGDAVVGHCVYPYARPIDEDLPFRPYPGCYPLSKVLEETMLKQYQSQYGLPSCCLRPPWIMAEDDLRCHLSFGDDVFGAPRWHELVGAEAATRHRGEDRVPVALAADGEPLRRNLVHVDDVVGAITQALLRPAAAHGQTFHVGMDEPFDYRDAARHLHAQRGLEAVDVATPYHSTWLDNTRAKLLLGWRPHYDYRRLIDAAWAYQRTPEQPRTIWYPG